MRDYRIQQLDAVMNELLSGKMKYNDAVANYIKQVLRSEMSADWRTANKPFLNSKNMDKSWLRRVQAAMQTEVNPKLELDASFVSPKALKIRVDPSGACNFKCVFCPCNNSNYMVEERHKIMSVDVFDIVLHDIAEFPRATAITLELYGYGEPLMNRELPEMIALAKQSLGIPVIFTTNGGLLNPELNTRLVDSGVDYIRISINALSSAQYKEVTGANINFETYVDNIRDLHEKAKGRTTIVGKIVDAAFRDPSDRDLFVSTFGGITDQIYVENVEGFWEDYGFQAFETNEFTAQGISYMYKDTADVCMSPFNEMMVFSNGDVGLCCSDWKHSTKYGSILQNSLYDLQRSTILQEIRRQHSTLPRAEIEACGWCMKKA